MLRSGREALSWLSGLPLGPLEVREAEGILSAVLCPPLVTPQKGVERPLPAMAQVPSWPSRPSWGFSGRLETVLRRPW